MAVRKPVPSMVGFGGRAEAGAEHGGLGGRAKVVPKTRVRLLRCLFSITISTVIADPMFTTSSQKSTNKLKVTIPPLKYAQSYTIYVGRYKSGNSGLQPDGKMKVTGWKKVATVGANSSKNVSAVIGKYGKTKLGIDSAWYGVKVVTHTKHGNSPGRYWLQWH